MMNTAALQGMVTLVTGDIQSHWFAQEGRPEDNQQLAVHDRRGRRESRKTSA